ncbi:MAG TPA: hypothetical protein VFF27_10435 [Bacteroidia bacterium]|jgi:hypothetical protein|nr:hypothetical protein [Bacteroidia bacterium]
MANYLISLNSAHVDKHSVLFDMRYANGDEIDFNNEGIGVLSSVKIKDIPSFLEDAINEKGLQEEYSGYHFGPVTEGEKILVPKGLVNVFIMDTNTILTKDEFYDTVLQIARKALEAVDVFHLKDKGIVDDFWTGRIKHAIPKLEAKLKNNL